MVAEQQTKPQPLEELWKKPCTDRAVLIGKGPSVDKYIPDTSGAVVAAINEAAATFPCEYMFYTDRNAGDVEIPETVVPVRSAKTAEKHGGRGYSYVSRDAIPDEVRGCASAHAVWILGKWGVKEILFVGFDGWDDPRPAVQYGKCIKAINPLPSPNYSKINGTIRAALDATGVRPIWFHRVFPSYQLSENGNG
jgi:hypothetical protein